jgi:nucleoside-diphosphate-sugar epimerase
VGVFKDSAQFYATVEELIDPAKKDPQVSPKIAKSGLIIQFKYTDPEAVTTINAKDTPIQADIRNPLLVALLRTEHVDTVCYLAFTESGRPTDNSFDINVIGTMKAQEACAEADVQKAVLKSSTSVFGARCRR